jgi:hypothetical protein
MTFDKRLNTILEEWRDLAALGEDDDILQKAKILKDHGYKFIQGMYESGGGGIYQIIAYCKHPELWSPYKVIRDFKNIDAYALCWEHDPEYSSLNNAGGLFYGSQEEHLATDDPLDNTRDHFGENVDEWFELGWGEILDPIGLNGVEKRFYEIFKAVTTKTPIDRWDGAPRSDL